MPALILIHATLAKQNKNFKAVVLLRRRCSHLLSTINNLTTKYHRTTLKLGLLKLLLTVTSLSVFACSYQLCEKKVVVPRSTSSLHFFLEVY